MKHYYHPDHNIAMYWDEIYKPVPAQCHRKQCLQCCLAEHQSLAYVLYNPRQLQLQQTYINYQYNHITYEGRSKSLATSYLS